MTNFTCALIGDELILVQCGNILLGQGHSVVATISTNPHVREWARSHEIPFSDNRDGYEEDLDKLSFDWLFSIANLRIIPESVWRQAKVGAVNFHDAPLPGMAGLNTPAWAILEGERRHGVTWHAINSGVDRGDIYASESFDITSTLR